MISRRSNRRDAVVDLVSRSVTSRWTSCSERPEWSGVPGFPGCPEFSDMGLSILPRLERERDVADGGQDDRAPAEEGGPAVPRVVARGRCLGHAGAGRAVDQALELFG